MNRHRRVMLVLEYRADIATSREILVSMRQLCTLREMFDTYTHLFCRYVTNKNFLTFLFKNCIAPIDDKNNTIFVFPTKFVVLIKF